MKRLHQPDGSQFRHIFLYQVVIRCGNDRQGFKQFPVCQMLSECHTGSSIAFWLHEWVHELAPVPLDAVCDSIPLLYAMVRSLTKCADLKDYINRGFGIIMLGEIRQCCVLRVDLAHFMKIVQSSKALKSVSLRATRECL